VEAFVIALVLLFIPGVALADPVTLVALAAGALQAGGYILATTAFAITATATIIGTVEARRRDRKARAAQRAQYNANLQDRSITAASTLPPHRCVYGRAVVGGDILAIFTSDKTVRDENGTTRTKADGLKHIIVHVCTREIEAINEVYIDGIAVGALDSTGAPTGGEFASVRQDSRYSGFTTSLALTEPAVEILGAWSTTGSGMDATQTPQTVTISGDGLTLTGPAGVPVLVDYRVSVTTPLVRVQKLLGTADQTVNSYLNGVLPSQWTTDHRLRGVSGVIVTLDLEESRFQGGPPGITVDVSGAKVYDPRTGTTAYSTNPALCIRDWLTSEMGYGCDADNDIDDEYTIAAANACDVSTEFDVGGTVTTAARYTCNGAFTSQESKEAILEDLAECMAGQVIPAAQWQISAGAWTAPELALTDDDLHGSVEIVQAGADMDAVFNSARATYIPALKSTPAEADPYSNSVFVAADGQELWEDFALPFTDNKARARNLLRIFTEQARDGLVIRYPAKLHAWRLRVGQRVTVTSSKFGWSAKTFRVTDWEFALDTAVVLTLQEDAEAVWDLADAATADPAANTDLASPWAAPALASFTATSTAAMAVRSPDGTVIPRAKVTWTLSTGSYIGGGAYIDIRWRQGGTGAWQSMGRLPADSTECWIVGARGDEYILVEGRYVNAFGTISDSRFISVFVVKSNEPIRTVEIATDAASAIDTDVQGGSSTLYLTEATICTAVVNSGGKPIYVSASVDASGGYDARDSTFKIKMDGTTQLTKTIAAPGDPDTIGNQWFVTGALIQYVIAAPSTGDRTITLTAVGSDAVYGVTVEKCDLYVEAKKR
jgi:hypothetical protein